MSEARITNLSNESNTGGPTISGITTFSSPYFFVPPVGSTLERPENAEEGALRFNTDSKHLEYFRGDEIGWVEVEASNEELNGGYRGMVAGGGPASHYNVIEYFTISTLGNGTDFGDITDARRALGSVASRSRAVMAGGITPADSWINTIDYITISSTGNATDFGDTTTVTGRWSGLCNQTRGVYGNMNVPAGYVNTLEYIAIAQTGNSVDFGDTTTARSGAASGSNGTRGVWAGGWTPTIVNTIDYITISTYGNSVDFGDLTIPQGNAARNLSSNSTRMLIMGGSTGDPSAATNNIDYITIATTGNGAAFGDLTAASGSPSAMFSPTRGLCSHKNPSTVVDYVEILTTGNSVDFGDMANAASDASGFSNGHGGLG